MLETSHNIPAGEPYCAPEFISIVEANIRILQCLVNSQPWTSAINELIRDRLQRTKNLVDIIDGQADVSAGIVSVLMLVCRHWSAVWWNLYYYSQQMCQP